MNYQLFSKSILIIFSFFTMYSCNPRDRAEIQKSVSVFDINQGRASILQGNQKFMKSFTAGDSVAVAGSYANDASILPAQSKEIAGRDGVIHYISLMMRQGVKNFTLETKNIWGDSSLLAEEGVYELADSLGNSLDKGKYIVLWTPEGGNWKMFRDIWTSDLPYPALLPNREEPEQ